MTASGLTPAATVPAVAAAAMPTDPPAAALWGLQCGDPHHEGHGYQRVYCHSRNRQHVTSLANNVDCYLVVRSDDGGQTWARADT